MTEDFKKNIAEISRDQWIFAGILVLLAFIAWFTFYLIVYQATSGVGIWAASALAFLTLAVAVALSFFLLTPRFLATATYLATALPAFLFFGWRGIEVIAVLVFFLTVFFGYTWVQREQKNLIPFWYSRLIRKGMPIFFTGLAFTLALFYNTSPVGRISDVPQIPSSVIDAVLIPVEYSLRTSIPDFRRDMKISEVEELGVRELPRAINVSPQLTNRVVKDYFSKLPAPEREKTITEFLTTFVNAQLQATILPYKQFLPVIYLFGLFLVFRALATPFMWIAIGLGWVIMKMLLRVNWLTLRKVEVEKEELVL